MKKLIFGFLCLMLGATLGYSQTGVISGKVTDELTGEELVGASVRVKDSNPLIGTSTDLSGNFQLRNVKPGAYIVVISYVSYSTQEITEVVVTAGGITTLNVALKEKVTEVEDVVIRASFKTNTANALLLQQKRSISIGDGISAEDIRKAPVSTSGDVIKKVSGASIQGGKFAVIRGLNDRYNTAYLNGAPLPSTEPDRRAFSFDIIPAGMLDQMVISKTATPDMPGDFSGGIIQITTKDFPELNFYNLSIGSGFNTITTFKDFASYKGGNLDFLGIDDGTRALPKGLNYNPDNNNVIASAANTNKFNNNTYGSSLNSAMPNASLQYSMGIVKRDSERRDRMFSAVLGITYSRSLKFSEVERQFRLPVTIDNQLLDSLQDKIYETSVLWGAIANLSFKINKNHRISLKNLYNVSTEDETVRRNRFDIQNDRDLRLESYYFIQNNIFSSQLSGDHYIPAAKLKVEWVGGINNIKRSVPDYRIMQYIKNAGSNDTNYAAAINPTPVVEFGGRFFSELNENLYSGRLDISRDLIDNKRADVLKKMDIKVGGALQIRDRTFDARFLGWTTQVRFDDPRLKLPLDQIFAPENTQSDTDGFLLADQTNPTDKYDASSNLRAAYIMFDNKLGKRFRLVWGARYEAFNQKLSALDANGNELIVDNNFNSLLPSANLVYELTELSNLRASVSKTVSRPEFRELAPFQFFNFNTFTSLAGEPNLQSATIMNYDLRYEFYPRGGGELVSVSAFYKDFTNPIEGIILLSGAGSFSSSFQNVPKATNYGAELEIRKKLSFVNKRSGFLSNSSVFGNFAYIISEVDLSSIATATANRPLQGQSNYIINAGLSFKDTAHNLDYSVTVNRVGKRIAIVGTGPSGLFPDVWENPRTIINLQVSKTWGKFAAKLSVSDLLAQPLIFYMDRSRIVDNNNTTGTGDQTGDNEAGKYDGRTKDVLISRTTFGRSISIGLSYKF
jgi:outer membrane receptor protein involved in Fe transport